MKLWYSFTKEMKLSSKSWYFYIELGMALILLAILLFVVPENFSVTQEEYIFLDMPLETSTQFKTKALENSIDGKLHKIDVKIDKKIYTADQILMEGKEVFFMDEVESLSLLAEKSAKLSTLIKLSEDGQVSYTYYLQGYESQRLKNLYLLLHNNKSTPQALVDGIESQKVEVLDTDYQGLSDRQNIIPIFLSLNGSFMGMFIIAAYIFLDKQEGIVKAYAVTASSIWQYLMSKIGVVIVTCMVSSLITMVPIMGLQPNYLLFFMMMIASGLFATTLGLIITTYYKTITQSFGALFAIIILMGFLRFPICFQAGNLYGLSGCLHII
jgi:ABC-2 type transport system permease protein